MKKHLKSRNPELNIPRRNEAVATDTVFSDTPAVDSGVRQAQVFVGRDTLVADAYPMKSGKQFVNTLEDNIWRRGAMDKLLSDSAKTEISDKVMDILRAYHISNCDSEPYHQNQNPAEWRYRTIKHQTFPSFYYSLSTNLCSMPHMTRISLLQVKRGLATG